MAKRYSVKITASAQADISAIWDFISQNNPSNAAEFIGEIEKKALSLSLFPKRNPVIPEAELLQISDYRHLVHKKYRVVYRIHNETVYILRIFHGSKLLDINDT
jgi:plasmid stabilization system protein ParE